MEVSIGEELLFTSQTVKNSLNPQWNEQCTVRLPRPTSSNTNANPTSKTTSPIKRRHGAHRAAESTASGEEVLELTVYDRDLLGREFMGSLVFSSSELRAHWTDERLPARWFDLRHVKRGRLLLRFHVLFDPFPDALLADADAATPTLTTSMSGFAPNNAEAEETARPLAAVAESYSQLPVEMRGAPARPQTLAIESQTSASAPSVSSRDTIVVKNDESRTSFQFDTDSFAVASTRVEQKTLSPPPSRPSISEHSNIPDSLLFDPSRECSLRHLELLLFHNYCRSTVHCTVQLLLQYIRIQVLCIIFKVQYFSLFACSHVGCSFS